MLKITIHDSAAECRFELAGRLEGAAAAELEQSWETARSTTGGRRTTVDLRALEGTDETGRALLERMFGAGVTEARTVPGKSRNMRLRFAAAALAPLVLLICPAQASGAEPTGARAALDRYLTAPATGEPEEETVHLEIRARLAKYGRSALARVVETIPRNGRAAFRLSSFEGDDMVKRQVIARYLSAEAEARERHDGSLAISEANYRFRFVRAVERNGGTAFVYQVEPRKKRAGLFKGELWLADSGQVLRQAGRMVKNPSLFVKRVEFVRDYDGEGAPRSLDVRLETRIAGAAELNIRYEPAAAADVAGL